MMKSKKARFRGKQVFIEDVEQLISLRQPVRLRSFNEYMTLSKPILIKYITITLSKFPKRKLARLAYNITKSKLPRLKTIKRRRLKFSPIPSSKLRKGTISYKMALRDERKTKRKFSKKQLAAQRLFAKRAKAGTLRKRRRR